MFDNKQVFCFILARGGSKGVPRKNVKLLNGKPLICHSIDVAKQVKYIDKIFVSTEDDEIKKISTESGSNVIDRPPELATDDSNYIDGVKHMLNVIPEIEKNPIIVLLETPLPIRKSFDIKNCIELLTSDIDCVASISEVKIPPVYMYRKKGDLLEKYENTLPTNRQQNEKLFNYNGSILITTANFLKNQNNVIFGGKMKGYLLDEKSSLDIDSILDFETCEFFINKENLKKT